MILQIGNDDETCPWLRLGAISQCKPPGKEGHIEIMQCMTIYGDFIDGLFVFEMKGFFFLGRN